MQKLSIAALALIAMAACGAADAPPPPTAPPSATAQPPRCPPGQYEIERCLAGGMAIATDDGPRAETSCAVECSSTPPEGSRGMPCAQSAPNRFSCRGAAP